MHVVLHHTVGVNAQSGFILGFIAQVGENVHARGVVPKEHGFAIAHVFLHEFDGALGNVVVHRFHAFFVQRAGVFHLLAALTVGIAVDHAARPEFFLELRVFGVVRIFRFFLRVEVVEVAVEFVEPVGGRQVLVEVTQVVFAELPAHVAHRLEHFCDGGVFLGEPLLGTGQAHFEQAGAYGRLAGEEGGASGRATVLAVPVGEQGTFPCDAVNVGGFVPHGAQVVRADVVPPDVVAPDDDDVGLLLPHEGTGDQPKGTYRDQRFELIWH